MSVEPLRAKLAHLADEMLTLREQVPTAPETGLRPEHRAMLDAMFNWTRERLLGTAETAHEGLAALAVQEAQGGETS